jgi:hypothetical protein
MSQLVARRAGRVRPVAACSAAHRNHTKATPAVLLKPEIERIAQRIDETQRAPQ